MFARNVFDAGLASEYFCLSNVLREGLRGGIGGRRGGVGSVEPKHHLNQRFRFSNLREGEGSVGQRTISIGQYSAIFHSALGVTHKQI